MVKRRIDISQYWRKLNINAKFRVAFGTLLVLIVLIAATSVVALKGVQNKTETAIVISTEIQRLVLGMDRALYKARSLEENFFLRYPTIGYSAAYQKYAQQANKQIKNVRALSIELQQLIAGSDVSDAWSESAVNLNLYLSSARRHMVTVKEAEGLIARLATDETGLQDELARISSLLQSALQIADDPDLMVLYHEMQSFEKNYLITRQRPLMQSAFNTAIPLQKAIKVTPTFEAGHKTKVLTYLDNYLAIAEEILELDIAIRSKFNEFDLEAEAVDPISEELINLVNQEIERARTQIGNRGQLSMIILVATSLVGLALSGIIVLVLNKSITLNVIKLTEVTGEFQAGNTEVRARIDSADELGKLADTFNAMATSISSLVGNLEQKVSERTSQLTKTNEQLMQEIKERKGVEESLKKSEIWVRNIFKSLNETVFVITLDRIFLEMNEAAVEMFGYTKKELLNVSSEIVHIDHEHYLEFGKKMKEVIHKGEIVNFQFKMRRKNGDIFPSEHTASLMVDNEGKSIGIVSVIRDLSEQKKIEEEKEQLQTQLQQSKKMEVIGTLAGGVAHDLNNILSGIVGYPELILMDLPEDSPLRKPISTIQKTGEKAAVIVQDLLTLARRGVSITEIVNLNHIISEQLKSPEFEKLISFSPDVKIETHLEKDLLNIKGSNAHLSKSVMNLVSNAAEAMIDGGTISVSTENRYIDRPIKGYDHVEEGDYVIVTVSDTGVGMSEEDMEKIFEPFYTKKAMGRSGTGLGMAVVWGTVKDHKGYIDLKSTPGKGTTFTLYFPVTREEVVMDKSLLSIEDYMGHGETVLVIDDVEEQREIASGMLRKLGYSATSVSSGEEAVEYMKNSTADLLVLDMIMDPGIDGLETYKRILELYPDQKAIIASGFSETPRVKEVIKLGAGAYVKKPYLIEKIGLAVKEELEK